MTQPDSTAIRPLTTRDLDAFIELRLEALNDSPFAFGSSPEDDKVLQKKHMREVLENVNEQVVFGCFEGNRLVGITGLFREEHLKMRHRAGIWGVYVTPEYRRKGVATAMMHQAIALAREWGLEQLDLGVSVSTDDAKRVYEAIGFRVWGRQPRAVKWNRFVVDEEYMSLQL
ncbi:MAG: GNAT family N-acetyltransferase [bacterium]|nr:GNAT family N-acetyltransferase [bacterium]